MRTLAALHFAIAAFHLSVALWLVGMLDEDDGKQQRYGLWLAAQEREKVR